MSKVKLSLDTRYEKNSGKFPVCIQLSHSVKTRFINLGTDLTLEQWNKMKLEMGGKGKIQRETAKMLHHFTKANKYIQDNELDIRYMDIDQLKRNIEIVLKKSENTSPIAIEKASTDRNDSGTLKNWGQILIDRARLEKRVGTAHWYKFGVDEFIRFNGKDVFLMDINETFLEEFKVWAATKIEDVKIAWKPNSIGNAMRAVRAIFNKAISEKKSFIVASHQPFKSVSIPNETIEVDSIEKKDIAALRKLDLIKDSADWKARAKFLFMYNCQGMNFTDLAKLKVGDLNKDILSYYRAKTIRTKQKKRIEVFLTKEAKDIWGYFTKGKTADDYAFDILHISESKSEALSDALKEYFIKHTSTNPAITEKNRIRRHLKLQNASLKTLSGKISSRVIITTYDARYGWVNSALEAGISEELIGKGLGHQNLVVTRRYFEEKHKKSSLGSLNELITK